MPESYGRAIRKVLDFVAIKRHAGAHALNAGIPCGIRLTMTEIDGSIMATGGNLLS